jgi:predicted NBD/HSP70 family sugar kinase
MYAVFDVGGTHIRLALSKDGRNLNHIERFDSDPGDTGFDAFCMALKSFVQQHDIKAVAGGISGQIDPTTGVLRLAPHLPGWQGLEVPAKLRQLLKVPVRIDNDAAVAGLGEAVHGAGREHSIVVYMTVSTGVNGARIVDGRIEPSAYGFEIGNQLVESGGRAVSLESLCGGAALQKKYGGDPKELREPKVWSHEAKYLAQGLYNTLLHWSPDIVIYNGSMMHDIAVEAISTELSKLPNPFATWPPLKLSMLGDEAGLYGGLVMLQGFQG